MPDLLLLLAGSETITAEPGDTVLSAMLRAGAAIQTVCKGKGICGACRVVVDGAYFDRLNPPSTSKTRMLRFLKSREENQEPLAHRLACQIVLEPSISGLRITPDPIKPRPLNKENKS
jgi:2Fe-2S ferredoxin